MRIVQLLPAMQMGGVERGVAELSRALCAAGAESIVLSRGGALTAQLSAHGARHIPFACGSKNLLSAPWRALRLRRLLRDLAPDIVHVRSRAPAWLLACAGGWRRVVSTFHGLYSVGAYSAQMTRADAVICPSTAVCEHLRTHYRVPQDKLHLIHRGVDWEYFDPDAVDAAQCAALRAQWQLNDTHLVFALVGRVSRIKGHTLFLHAFARLLRQPALHAHGKTPCALILGNAADDPRCARLRQLAAQLGIGDSLRFGGECHTMREAYACCDVLVSASTRPEAFGRTVAEALAMQRAVAAPAHGGALDIVQDGVNGALFAPHDAPGLAEAMAHAAHLPRTALRESVAAFTLSQMAAQTIALYRRLLSPPIESP